MKEKIKLTKGINLINKKYKNKEFYHFFEEPSNVIVIPKFKKYYILVKQKRIPINKKNFEFPMGWIDKGENSLSASKRELLEETGYKSLINPIKFLEFYPDPGRGNRKCFCYFTDKLKKIGKEEKNIEIFFKTKNEIQKMINIKEFNNSSHIAAFSHYINKF